MPFARGRLSICAALCLAALALAAGCGGKSTAPSSASAHRSIGGSGSPTGPAGEKQRFVAQADGLCARINAEIVAIKANGSSRAEVIRVVPRTLLAERSGISELEKLGPPPSIAGDWQRMLDYRRTLADELTQLLVLAKRNERTSTKSLAASKSRMHAALSKLAKGAGFKDCAKIGRVG